MYLSSEFAFLRLHSNPFNNWVLIIERESRSISCCINPDIGDILENMSINPNNFRSKKLTTNIKNALLNLQQRDILVSQLTEKCVWFDALKQDNNALNTTIEISEILSHITANCFGPGSPIIDSRSEFDESMFDYIPNAKSSDRFLDAGCGHGLYTDIITKKGYISYLVDCTIPNLRNSPLPINKYIHKINSYLEKLPFRSGSFAACICMFVLEHVADVTKVIKELRRVLSDNSVTIISVPSRYPSRDASEISNPFHLRYFTIGEEATFRGFEYPLKSFEDCLENYGFIIENKISERSNSLRKESNAFEENQPTHNCDSDYIINYILTI